MTTARNFYDPFTDPARFHGDLPKSGESIAALCPTPPPAAFSKRQDIARFCCLRRRQPAGHIKACKNPKTQTFCIPLRCFFRKCICGKNRCSALQKTSVSHTVIWDIQKKRQKSSLRRAERNRGSTAPHPPENNEKVAQSFKKDLTKYFSRDIIKPVVRRMGA